jgi:hypothetical protein
MQKYQEQEEEKIKIFFNSLHEKDQRHFASLQAEILGYGGVKYTSELLGISVKTIYRGSKENIESTPKEQIRKKGAGRKTFNETLPTIDEMFLSVLKEHTAGNPMNDKILWTNLKQEEICLLIYKKFNVNVSRTVIRQLLENHNYKRRKLQKDLPLKEVADRNEQFININKLKNKYIEAKNPIISIDTKKKELIGNFYRDGQLYSTETIFTFDHDFKSFAEGVIIPFGIYDYVENKGYMYIGNSKDTSEFSCKNIKKWWEKYGKEIYKNANSILILCDGGGSNNSRHYVFKDDLQKLSNSIGIEIRIAHYPPYTSKYNPIEHRLFSYISKAWSGVVFDSIETVKRLIEKTTTKKGLKVEVEIIDEKFEIGRKLDADYKKNMKILFDDYLPKWNYKVVPQKK